MGNQAAVGIGIVENLDVTCKFDFAVSFKDAIAIVSRYTILY